MFWHCGYLATTVQVLRREDIRLVYCEKGRVPQIVLRIGILTVVMRTGRGDLVIVALGPDCFNIFFYQEECIVKTRFQVVKKLLVVKTKCVNFQVNICQILSMAGIILLNLIYNIIKPHGKMVNPSSSVFADGIN